ncbi:MAG: hypothetical protein EPN23_11095 [Verrucomicrobia bacterium]|nr:MAG: hypothetical protein EPN23_11095 [Verrucomicrobiota bacterium]
MSRICEASINHNDDKRHALLRLLAKSNLPPFPGYNLFFITIFFATSFMGCSLPTGERYTKEGNALSVRINNELASQGFCHSPKECDDIFEMYGGHGDRVHFSIYAPNTLALAMIFKLLVEKGTEITNGVAISVTVYPRPRDEYGNTAFYSHKPSIILEITQ